MTSAKAVRQAPGWRARLARLLLFGGVAVAVVSLLPSVPREQILLFRLQERELVRELRATWSVPGREPEGGVTLHFSEAAPHTVRHSVSLPNGSYVLDVRVERAESPSGSRAHTPGFDSVAGQGPSRVGSELRQEPPTTTYVRRVSLEGGETVIRL
ncbi:MAG TPA: hypothetical protein VK524_03330 [Polyangiaceae bacterium]|nr:hypothetical protein [Polyangiaceae bacterium]